MTQKLPFVGSRGGGSPRALGLAFTLLGLLITSTRAASVASDTGCNEAIGTSNGANGGSGFNAWTNVSIGSGGGTYTATDAGLSSNGCATAWGIFTGGGSVVTSVQRPFTNGTALSVGQTIAVDMQNGGIQTGGSEGLSLYNASGNAVWELFFSGGASFWTTNASPASGTTTIPYSGSGCRVFFTLKTSTTYSLVVQVPVGGTNYFQSGGTLLNPSGGQSITQLRFFTFNIGSGNNLQFNNLGVGYDAPTISAQPASTTTTNFGATTPAMTVTGSSNDGSSLTYAWRKRGSGWGSAWTFDNVSGGGAGSAFLASSTNIDTSGQAWGLQQTTGASAADAIRALPATLSSNQTFSVDMDNYSITSGGSVGITLQDTNGNMAFEFGFHGGSNDYFIHNNASGSTGSGADTLVPFTSTGLHLDFTLTSSTNYTLKVKRLSDGSATTLTGSTIGAVSIQRVRFFDFQSGNNNNVYFNNLAVAGADDNAGNYSGSWSGDKGQKPLSNGASGTGSTYAGATTSSFTIQNAQIADGTNSYDCAVISGQGLTTISSSTALTVNKANSATAVVSSSNPSVYGQGSVTFTASVSDNTTGSSGTPTGTVQFQTNGVNFGSAVSLSGGSATSGALLTTVAPGSVSVTATYNGDGNFNTSSSTTLTQTVNKASSATAIQSSSNPSVYGQSGVTFTATVTDNSPGSSGTPTGTVQFQTNGVNFGSAVSLSGGSATSGALLTTVAAGSVTVTASYNGDGNFNGSSSGNLTQTINQASTSLAIGSSENPSGYRDSVTISATLPSDATGSVIFRTNGVAWTTNSMSSGVASAVTALLPRGTNTVAAEYAGDSNYLGSTNTLSQAVTNHPPTAAAATYSRPSGFSLKIPISNLSTNWSDVDGDTVSLAGLGSSTNGATLSHDSIYIYYLDTNNVTDQFTYTVSDGQGGTNSGTVTVVIASQNPGAVASSITASGGVVTIQFAGIPFYNYWVEATTNLADPLSWQTIGTNTAGTNGLFQFSDNSATNTPAGVMRAYRLQQAN